MKRQLTSILLIISHTVASQDDLGTFASPAAITRPRFRYWLPDASVSPAVVRKDTLSASSIGAGGVEFLPFYNYGGELGGAPPGADWSTYNFGSEASNELLVAALEAHREGGLRMDFALGPNQGQGVPAEADDEGLQWDLVPFSASIPAGESFNDTLPGWGTGKFIAAVSAKVVSETNVSINMPPSTFLVVKDSYLDIVVENGTLLDHSDQVDQSTGHLSTSFADAGASYRLFAFYEKRTENHNLVPAREDPRTIFEDGSYTVDHFDARGAQTVINFWEQHVLNDNVRGLLSEAGQCGWEDSMELLSNVSWSRQIPARFQRLHGYDIRPGLPLIMFGNNNINIQSGNPGAIRVTLDSPDQGAGYVNDYRIALAEGYQEYLSTLVNWTHSLNVTFSSQVSYNMPLDMEASIPFVDVPECESLQFEDNVDGYRQFSATAYLAGRNVVSIEIGAVFGLAYEYTIPDLLFSVNRALAGGVNRFVIHGQSYSGNYTATTWPGYTAFGYLVSDLYSDKQPSWNHGLQAAMDYMSRMSWVQQQGVGKLDLAFYNRQSATDPTVHTLYTDSDLNDAGWTYGYISPSNFDLPDAVVRDGVLSPDGPGFTAIVVQAEQKLTLAAAEGLQKYADAGLPIIFLGGDPGYYQSRDNRGEGAVEDAIVSLKKSANVHSVAAGELVSALRDLGLTPQMGVQTNGTWWTTWREDEASGIDYAFIFGDTNATMGQIEVQSTKTPYVFDAWTAAQAPLLEFVVEGNVTRIPLSLAGNQTVIIAFAENPLSNIEAPSKHITNSTGEVLGYATSSTGLVAHVASSSSGQIEVSSGETKAINGSTVPAAIELTNWTLTAEHWEAPENLDDASVVAVKRNTTHQLDSLVSWTQIPELVNVSGVGYYETTFSRPPVEGTSDLGAYIDFSAILHAITLYVNGHRTVPLDYTKPILDISAYLREGENSVVAVVPTTMGNYLGSLQAELRNGGENVTLSSKSENGLVGQVRLIPYQSVELGG